MATILEQVLPLPAGEAKLKHHQPRKHCGRSPSSRRSRTCDLKARLRGDRCVRDPLILVQKQGRHRGGWGRVWRKVSSARVAGQTSRGKGHRGKKEVKGGKARRVRGQVQACPSSFRCGRDVSIQCWRVPPGTWNVFIMAGRGTSGAGHAEDLLSFRCLGARLLLNLPAGYPTRSERTTFYASIAGYIIHSSGRWDDRDEPGKLDVGLVKKESINNTLASEAIVPEHVREGMLKVRMGLRISRRGLHGGGRPH